MIHLGSFSFDVGTIPAASWNAFIANFVANLRATYGGDRYADGFPIVKSKTQIRTVHKETEEKISPKIEESLLIKLGGEFAEIGGESENIGGGNQKLG